MQTTVSQLVMSVPHQHAARPLRLTPRELEVLALLCEGLSNKLISRRLNISAATVKCHISRILDELGVASRLQAVVAAARRGLVPVIAAARPPSEATGQLRSPRAAGTESDARPRRLVTALF